jgi:hypothetical protein
MPIVQRIMALYLASIYCNEETQKNCPVFRSKNLPSISSALVSEHSPVRLSRTPTGELQHLVSRAKSCSRQRVAQHLRRMVIVVNRHPWHNVIHTIAMAATTVSSSRVILEHCLPHAHVHKLH